MALNSGFTNFLLSSEPIRLLSFLLLTIHFVNASVHNHTQLDRKRTNQCEAQTALHYRLIFPFSWYLIDVITKCLASGEKCQHSSLASKIRFPTVINNKVYLLKSLKVSVSMFTAVRLSFLAISYLKRFFISFYFLRKIIFYSFSNLYLLHIYSLIY